MDLARDETADLRVWAYPKEGQLCKVEDELVCCIKDNPDPVRFKISCEGSKPEVGIDRDGMMFDPLRVSLTNTQELNITNVCLLPVKWHFDGLEALTELGCFTVSKSEGTIEPHAVENVKFQFEPTEPNEYNTQIQLRVSDIDGLCDCDPQELEVSGESYDIMCRVDFPDGEEGAERAGGATGGGTGTRLDYGLCKVSDEPERDIVIHNDGKFDIKYQFSMRKRRFAGQPIDEIFKPPEENEENNFGVLKQEEGSRTVSLKFATQKEMELCDNTDIRIKILDAQSQEFICAVPVPVSVEAVFSKYRLVPSAINFGSLVYGDSKEKFFDIQNKGQHEFNFELFDFNMGRDPEKPPVAGQLTIGCFQINPASGSVPAGGQISIQILMETDSAQLVLAKLGVYISEADPLEMPTQGTMYEVVGESCIPCISTTQWNSIFEEQAVVSHIDFGESQSNVYSEEQRLFSYGPVLIGKHSDQRFRITNPNRVPCDVTFTCSADAPTGKGAVVPDAPEFEILDPPKDESGEHKVHIPVHESRFVAVRYKPSGMLRSTGHFEADVARGKQKLVFDLFGEGTLPSINICEPTEFAEDGSRCLSFGRLRLGRERQLPITIRNDGILPATLRSDISQMAPGFFFDSAGAPITIDPRMSRTLDLKFMPSEVGDFNFQIKFIVSQNEYEDNRVTVRGEGFTEDALFEGLKGDNDNLVEFADFPMGTDLVPSKTFTIANQCADHMVFEFPTEHPNLTFEPQKVHVHGGASQQITVKFSTEEPSVFKDDALQEITYTSQKFSYPDEVQVQDWNNTMTMKASELEEELIAKPEPQIELDDASKEDKTLLMEASADFLSFSCETASIEMRPTAMFQRRAEKFELVNESKIRMPFAWAWQDANGNDVPGGSFSVTPQEGEVAPEATQQCTVSFEPFEVQQTELYLVSRIPNLKEGCEQHKIQVYGSSTRPWCYFELEPNDYISADRREPGPGSVEPDVSFGIIDASTHVVEFKSLGTNIKNTRRFYVTNPTSIAYDFEWECGDGTVGGPFKCQELRGTIIGGKTYEMVFEFTPEDVHTQESFWKFSVPEKGIEVFVLLVGSTTDPDVHFEVPHFKFGNLLVGGKGAHTVNLINNEHIPFSFNFQQNSYMPGGHKSALSLSPSKGVLPPGSQIPISITLTPDMEKDYNFNLVCDIRNKPTPLSLNVKGQGYAIHDAVQLVDKDGKAVTMSSELANQVNFGALQTNDKREKTVQLINSGSFNFDYKFVYQRRMDVRITPDSGTVRAHEKSEVTIEYHPRVEGFLQGYQAQLRIQQGRAYTLLMNGMANKPKIVFSFLEHAFGACFLHKRGMDPHEAILTITNNDVEDHSVDLEFENKPYLEVSANPMVLQPGLSATVPIRFFPRDITLYHETLEFEINALEKVQVQITGEGAPAKLELVDQVQATINFGAVSINQEVTKQVQVVNRSKIDLDYSLEKAVALLAPHNVSMGRTVTGTLRPRQVGLIDLTFRPSQRIRPFNEEIQVEYAGITHPLFGVNGAGHGVELKMDTDTLIFGDTVVNSKVTRKLGLENTGDVGVGFKWDEFRFAPHGDSFFSISPLEGFLAPNQSMMFTIQFAPTREERDIRVDNIQMSVDGNPPMFLTLTGSAVGKEPDGQVFSFSTQVRNTEVQKIPIKNVQNCVWRVKPAIDNDYWSGDDMIEIAAGQSKDYMLTYHPLVMTDGESEDESKHKHKGSIFFPLPDGTALLYKLEGTAAQPNAEADSPIKLEVPSKKVHTVRVPVTNWLKQPQRFKVELKVESTAEVDEDLVLTGLKTMDVPPLKTKDFKLVYHPFKPGDTKANITFTNKETGEYLFYNMELKAGQATEVPEIKLDAIVRQKFTHQIPIENPFNSEVELTVQLGACAAWDITYPPKITVAAQKEELLQLNLRPLLAGENDCTLTLSCAELGTYEYQLKLCAAEAGPEGGMHFSTDLGGTQMQKFRFISYVKKATSYVVSFDNSDFVGDAKVDAAAADDDSEDGIEVETSVTYEPSVLGDIHGVMFLKSAEGGVYTVNLHGNCVAPKPRGPFNVKGSLSLPFKNVFAEDKEFTFSVDNPCFTVNKSQVHKETMAVKKEINLSITFAQQDGASSSGKLVAASPGVPNSVFYLTGEK
jgi:hydrocephalus-inducing protein